MAQMCGQKKGASFEMKFKGSKVYLIGTLDSGHGKATVTVDGKGSGD